MAHFKTVCLKCGTVITQCECIGPKEATRYVTCYFCAQLPIGVPPAPTPESTQVTLHEGTAPTLKLPPQVAEAIDEALASIDAAMDALQEKSPPVKPMWFGLFLAKFGLR
jgi:hypothetical protein